MKKNIWKICFLFLLWGGVGFAQNNIVSELIPFDANELFPTWQDADADVSGIIGENVDGKDGLSEKLILQYIPQIIHILLKFVAPLVMGVFLFAGIRFIYADDKEEDITKSKIFFMYALMGVLFIVLSYSLLKVLYFLIAFDGADVSEAV